MNQFAAETTLYFRSPSGKEFISRIFIGLPQKVSGIEWKCDVEIENVSKLRTAYGVDSLQALVCALSLAQAILVGRSKKGWEYFWSEAKHPTTPEKVFGFDFNTIKNET